MGSGLARIGDVPALIQTQRDALIAFEHGLAQTVTRLKDTFTEDTASMQPAAQAVAARILARATTIVGNINDEMALLNDSAQTGEAWFKQRVENGRQIVDSVEELSEDMVGFLQTGRVPSEDRRRRNLFIFGGVAAAVSGLGYWWWWRNEKAAEAEQERMLASGEIEDCGCGG